MPIRPGAEIITPVDLVPGADSVQHPQVTNITRFLQSLDDDQIHMNGIRILPVVFEALLGQSLDFDMDPVEFETTTDVVALVTTIREGLLGPPLNLVPISVAQALLMNTLYALGLDPEPQEPEPGAGGELHISGADTGTIGASFIPTGPVFPHIGEFSSIQWNEARPDFTAMGVGVSFFPGEEPYGVEVVWQSTTDTYGYGISCNEINSARPVVDCSGIVADFAAGSVTLNDQVVLPVSVGNPITLNGTLYFTVQ